LTQLALALALLPAGELLADALEQLLAPRVGERLGDLVLATDVLDGTVERIGDDCGAWMPNCDRRF
jgi:hypothetical protein